MTNRPADQDHDGGSVTRPERSDDERLDQIRATVGPPYAAPGGFKHRSCSAALAAASGVAPDQPAPTQMTMTPHPFHIVGECQDCCDESEAMRLGYPGEPHLGYCETPGCVNAEPGPETGDKR